MTSQAALKRMEKAEAVERLREIVKPGDTVYTVLRHVSASGTTRDIDFYVIRDSRPRYLTSLVARATGQRLGKRGLRVGGAGMDMGFAVVYGLARTLFRDGFACIGKDGDFHCPSNDHMNEGYGRTSWEPGRIHSDPGYALQQEWL